MPAIVVIRHGETSWSKSHRHTGRTDLPLTPEGESQVRQLRRRLAALWPAPFAHVWTSPLRRASDTCALTGFVGTCRIEPNLREWDCGEYEGRTLAEIQAQRPAWNLFRDGCPGGESPEQVGARVDALIEDLRLMDGPIALFSHGHLLCALAARWIGLTVSDGAHFRLDTASFGVLDVEHNSPAEPSIATWNISGTDGSQSHAQAPLARRRSGRIRAA
ncbi:MAG TPA: histidine phosphatase family protein [Vicinamibacterales bacterium]|nr:histidine phosphatase family protein [Vicinamibacterales bacterium]